LVRVRQLAISGYRSIKKLTIDLADVAIVLGPNGSGKTNLYRALQLLHRAAQGTLARGLLEEGGMPSALWAGSRERSRPMRIRLEVSFDELTYSLDLGLPVIDAAHSAFARDPEVKSESIDWNEGGARSTLLERRGSSAFIRDADGKKITFPFEIWSAESVLSQIVDPGRFPVPSVLRVELMSWRFYHGFRSDDAAPARHPQPGVRTPVLSHDGSDLAAAIQTIFEIGDRAALDRAVKEAFPGSKLVVVTDGDRFGLEMKMPGIGRRLRAVEFSDGMLRYLSLVAALLSPRPAPFLVLNEPETSIHPELWRPLAVLIAGASKQSQIFLTTHSRDLADQLDRKLGIAPIQLAKTGGETQIAGRADTGEESEDSSDEDPITDP
jgi:predicted ATPase